MWALAQKVLFKAVLVVYTFIVVGITYSANFLCCSVSYSASYYVNYF
jgi:hypothetical protein